MDRIVAAGRTVAAPPSAGIASVILAQSVGAYVVVTGGYRATTPAASFLDAIDRNLAEAITVTVDCADEFDPHRGVRLNAPEGLVRGRVHAAHEAKMALMSYELGFLCGRRFVEWYERIGHLHVRLELILSHFEQGTSTLPTEQFEDIQREVTGLAVSLDDGGCLTPAARDALTQASEALATATALTGGDAARQADAFRTAHAAISMLCESDALLRSGPTFCALYGRLRVLDEGLSEASDLTTRARADAIRAALERALILSADLRSMLAST